MLCLLTGVDFGNISSCSLTVSKYHTPFPMVLTAILRLKVLRRQSRFTVALPDTVSKQTLKPDFLNGAAETTSARTMTSKHCICSYRGSGDLVTQSLFMSSAGQQTVHCSNFRSQRRASRLILLLATLSIRAVNASPKSTRHWTAFQIMRSLEHEPAFGRCNA